MTAERLEERIQSKYEKVLDLQMKAQTDKEFESLERDWEKWYRAECRKINEKYLFLKDPTTGRIMTFSRKYLPSRNPQNVRK
jgi:hypothetical protein